MDKFNITKYPPSYNSIEEIEEKARNKTNVGKYGIAHKVPMASSDHSLSGSTIIVEYIKETDSFKYYKKYGKIERIINREMVERDIDQQWKDYNKYPWNIKKRHI